MDMDLESKERELIQYINRNNGINCAFGKLEFNNKDRIGQGGNGLVYLARINEKDVAVKFLISDLEKKQTRFKSEFFNTNFVRNKLFRVVNMIHYDELLINDGVVIPYIIMSKYKYNLKKFRSEKENITENDFNNLVNFLFNSIDALHKQGILHRDIKPENILVDDNSQYYLTDFGIASFEKGEFPIDNKTKKGERLANIEFSAPEQISNKFEVTEASYIYSMAQVMYWFLFGSVNRGTGAERISSKYDWEEAYIYDNVINKCLRNNPDERFQQVSEIFEYIQAENAKRKELDPFEDMYKFHDAILSVVPEFYGKAYKITDKDIICELFDKIFSEKYNQQLEFNSGKGNNKVFAIEKLENGDFLMGVRQLNIVAVWGLITDDIYDDILILELADSKPYLINGTEYSVVAVIENEEIVPYDSIASGFVRYKGKVCNTSNLNIQERFVSNDYKAIAIAPFHSCTIIKENDEHMRVLQDKSELKKEDIENLKKEIHMNQTKDVYMRL